MFGDLDLFPFGLEGLVGVGGHLHGGARHLIRHHLGLVSRVVLAQNQAVEASETEDVEKVPRGGTDPRGVQGRQLHASLQHRLVTDRQRKWNLGGEKAGKGVIDPASDDDHGQDVGHVSLNHVGHHGRVRHGIFHLRLPLVHFEVAFFLVVEEELAPQKRLFRNVFPILPKKSAANESLTVLDAGQVDGLVAGEQNGDVMADDADEECDDDDGEKDPNADIRSNRISAIVYI